MAAAALAAAPAGAVELRFEGSMPLQYIETRASGSRADMVMAAPYFAAIATHQFQPELSASVFADAGHAPLGQFRDSDDTFGSFGANIVKRWGTFSAGASLERIHFYKGTFGPLDGIANDASLFARYEWRPNADFRMTPVLTGSLRADDAASVQRYTATARLDIERRLVGNLWAVALPRLRYSDYVGVDSGRRDFAASIVAGLKYEFNANVTARLLAGYENRSSTLADKSRERFVAGASLDFSFDVGRSR